MSSPPFDIAEGSPANSDAVSNYPSVERTFRSLIVDIINREHDLPASGGSALHKFGVGNDATRDGTTDWVVGSIFFNTKSSPVTLQRVVSIGPVVWEDVAGGGITLAGSNTWTALQTISLTSATVNLSLVSTDAGAAVGPVLKLFRNSASPATSDFLGGIEFVGNNASAAAKDYGFIYSTILDKTASSEDGDLRLQTIVAGATGDRVIVGQGLYTAGATGGDKGANTINATTLYQAGTAINNLGAASQAQMEAGSATTVAVTPGVAQYHPGMAKCWGKVTNSGTASLAANYNITSINRSATGTVTVTIATDFSSANYAVVACCANDASDHVMTAMITTQSAGSFVVETRDNGDTNRDCNFWFACFGDQ